MPLVGIRNRYQIRKDAPRGYPKESFGNIIGAFKSITTTKYIEGVKQKNWKRFDKKLWQWNYFERIIRNKKEFDNITRYIKNNPSK